MLQTIEKRKKWNVLSMHVLLNWQIILHSWPHHQEKCWKEEKAQDESKWCATGNNQTNARSRRSSEEVLSVFSFIEGKCKKQIIYFR